MRPLTFAARLAVGVIALASAVPPTPVEAQQSGNPSTSSPNPTITPPPGTTGNTPQLVTSEVKLDGGWRASKLIGASVYDDGGQKVGSVDDLVVSGQDRIAVVVVSVGGFLGIGSKLIAVPFAKLRYDPSGKDARVVMPGATKTSLEALPGFTYTGN